MVDKKNKKLVKLIIVVLVTLIMFFILTLAFNKNIRIVIAEKIKEIFVASEIETKIDYEIKALERRKIKCIFNDRKSKRNR